MDCATWLNHPLPRYLGFGYYKYLDIWDEKQAAKKITVMEVYLCIYMVCIFCRKNWGTVADSHLQEAKNTSSLPLLYQTSQKTVQSHRASSLTSAVDTRTHCKEHH